MLKTPRFFFKSFVPKIKHPPPQPILKLAINTARLLSQMKMTKNGWIQKV